MQEGIVPILIKHFDRSMLSSDTKNDNIAGFPGKREADVQIGMLLMIRKG